MSTRRKLALASWDGPREGNIYGKLTVDATEATRFIAWAREKTGYKITITHLVGKAVAAALAKSPGLNGRIFFGSYIPFDHVNLSFLVSLEDGQDLAKALIEDIDKKNLSELADELRALAAKLRQGKDPDFEKSKGLIKALPSWLLKPLLTMTGWLASSAGLSIPALGVTPYPFGSGIITSVGMFGLDEGFAPPTPFARVPVYVLVGALRDMPAVIDQQIVIRKQLTITATIDHRFLDGHEGGRLAKTVRDVLENPWQLEGMQGPPVDAEEV